MKVQYLFLIWITLCLCSFTGCTQSQSQIIWEEESEEETAYTGVLIAEAVTEKQVHSIYVDICGAVVSPGVYELEEGARVYEVIDMAGGLTEEADDTAINRAELLTDGSKIQIYTRKERELQKESEKNRSPSDMETFPSDGRVNINKADVSMLVTLPGIGASRAEDIIAYREEHGSFQSVEDIMNVNGIKEGTFQKIKDKITTE